jgi:hypothetical protein
MQPFVQDAEKIFVTTPRQGGQRAEPVAAAGNQMQHPSLRPGENHVLTAAQRSRRAPLTGSAERLSASGSGVIGGPGDHCNREEH